MENNYSNKAEEKKVTKVITGTAKTRKKNVLEKLVDTFIMEDFKTVKEKVVEEVIIPRVKQTAADACTNIINMLFFGASSGIKSNYFGSSSTISYKGSSINYSGISSNKQPLYSKSSIPTYDEIVLADRMDAERVLDDLNSMIGRFGEVTILDLYELVGLPSESTFCNYGWKTLKGADIGAVRDGFLLKLPKAILLK